MTVDEIDTVCFVGAGTMGCANSLVAAVSGYDVVLNDADQATLDAIAARHDEIGAFLVAVGYCTDDELAAGLARVRTEPDLAAATAAAQLISESIFEDRQVKRDLHRRIDAVAPADAIQTTNTSTLLVSDLEDVVERGERFAALHSHLGALLFDIVGGPRTSPDTVDVLRRYVLSLNGVPLVLNKEYPGYVFNAMIGPVLTSALRLVLDERATQADVDRAWMRERGAPMGPFGMMDLFGLDLMLDTWRKTSPDTERAALRERVLPVLAPMVAAGNLGQKTGRGFYEYPSPAYQAPTFLDDQPVSRVAADALTAALVASAETLVAEGVASADDVNMAWKVATGLAQGPLGD